MLKFEAKREIFQNLAKTGRLHPPGFAAHDELKNAFYTDKHK